VIISEIAKEYLADKPSAWLNVAKLACEEVSCWVNQQQDLSSSLDEHQLSRFLLEEFLSPTFVLVVANSNDLNEAQDNVTNLVDDLLKFMPINEYDQIVDPSVAQEIYSGYEKDYLREYLIEETGQELLSHDTTIHLFYDKPELRNRISSLLNESNIAKILELNNDEVKKRSDSAFRFDVIDTAMYEVLIQHPELLRSVSWRAFENLLADILESFGYIVELQQGTKDGGVDLFAIKKSDTFGPQRFLLQAKRWTNKVGIEPVRQLAFLQSHYHVTKACLATTATFTRGAWGLANQSRWQLELRDSEGILEWIKQAAAVKLKF
jgi:HJR/Mrr/RecB family endonuclease